ncbi:MAG: hypothetical protein FJ088_16330, partial [Deltaproteobacteria bacterium]|nr:hypothetical protein [Deltaproteobacteria bacterium]
PLTNQTFGLTKNLVEGACDALITTGSTYLRNMLMSLDAEPDNFSIGTKEPCKTYDTKNKMKIDALGNKMKQCLWDAKLKVGGSYYDPDGTFYGTAKQ